MLISHLLHIQWEKHIKEQYFIAPHDALLLRLLVQPTGPFVLDQLVVEPVVFGQYWQ